MSCSFTAPVASCSAPATTGTIQNGSIKMVAVTYTVSGTGTGSVSINIGSGLATGDRTVVISIPAPTITPTGTTITTTPQTDSSYTFTITNSATASETYQITPICTGAGLDPGCWVSATSAALASSGTTNVTLYYSTLAAGSTGTLGPVPIKWTPSYAASRRGCCSKAAGLRSPAKGQQLTPPITILRVARR